MTPQQISNLLTEDINTNNGLIYDYLLIEDIEQQLPYLLNQLKKNPRWAFKYAKNIIGGRWPEAEPIIMKDPTYADMYKYLFR